MPTKQDSSDRPNVPSVLDTMLSEPVVSMAVIELELERFKAALREMLVDIQPQLPPPSEENPYVLKLTKDELHMLATALRKTREIEQEFITDRHTSRQARLINQMRKEHMNIWIVLSGLTDVELL